MYTHMYIHVNIYTYIYLYICLHIQVFKYIHISIIYIYNIYIYIRAHTYICIDVWVVPGKPRILKAFGAMIQLGAPRGKYLFAATSAQGTQPSCFIALARQTPLMIVWIRRAKPVQHGQQRLSCFVDRAMWIKDELRHMISILSLPPFCCVYALPSTAEPLEELSNCH